MLIAALLAMLAFVAPSSACGWILWEQTANESKQGNADQWLIVRAYETLADCDRRASIEVNLRYEALKKTPKITDLHLATAMNEVWYTVPQEPPLTITERHVCLPSDFDPRAKK